MKKCICAKIKEAGQCSVTCPAPVGYPVVAYDLFVDEVQLRRQLVAGVGDDVLYSVAEAHARGYHKAAHAAQHDYFQFGFYICLFHIQFCFFCPVAHPSPPQGRDVRIVGVMLFLIFYFIITFLPPMM